MAFERICVQVRERLTSCEAAIELLNKYVSYKTETNWMDELDTKLRNLSELEEARAKEAWEKHKVSRKQPFLSTFQVCSPLIFFAGSSIFAFSGFNSLVSFPGILMVVTVEKKNHFFFTGLFCLSISWIDALSLFREICYC